MKITYEDILVWVALACTLDDFFGKDVGFLRYIDAEEFESEFQGVRTEEITCIKSKLRVAFSDKVETDFEALIYITTDAKATKYVYRVEELAHKELNIVMDLTPRGKMHPQFSTKKAEFLRKLGI